MQTSSKWAAAAVVLGLCAATSAAAAVYDTPVTGANLNSSRSIGDPGIRVSGTAGEVPTSFTIAWLITQDPVTDLWKYEYTTTFDARQAVSHVLLDLSDDCTVNSRCIIDPRFDVTTGTPQSNVLYETHSPGDPDNPNLQGTIVGAKFDNTLGESPFTISFSSVRAPVWGDIYMKAGSAQNGWQAQNTGINDHGSDNILDFVARPNGVPEPGGVALIGLGLAALGLARRRYC